MPRNPVSRAGRNREEDGGPVMSFGRLDEIARTVHFVFPNIPYTFERTPQVDPAQSVYNGQPPVRNRTVVVIGLSQQGFGGIVRTFMRSRADVEGWLARGFNNNLSELLAFIPHEYDGLGTSFNIEAANLDVTEPRQQGVTNTLRLDFLETIDPSRGEEVVLRLEGQLFGWTDGFSSFASALVNAARNAYPFDPAQGRVYTFNRLPSTGGRDNASRYGGLFSFFPNRDATQRAEPFGLDGDTTVVPSVGPVFVSLLETASSPNKSFFCRARPVRLRVDELTLDAAKQTTQAQANNWIDLTIADVALARELRNGGIVLYDGLEWSVTSVSILARRNRAALRCRRI